MAYILLINSFALVFVSEPFAKIIDPSTADILINLMC